MKQEKIVEKGENSHILATLHTLRLAVVRTIC